LLPKLWSRSYYCYLSTVRNLVYKQMNVQIVDTLLFPETLKTENAEIFQFLTHKDLADVKGISTESTVKLLKIFERDCLIELH